MRENFLASLDFLEPMLASILQYGESVDFQQKQLKKIHLASEEILVNIIKYSYPQGSIGEICIECFSWYQEKLKISISDRGIPYNPVIFPRSIITNDRQGYGLILVHKLIDEILYQRKAQFNCLTLVKYYED